LSWVLNLVEDGVIRRRFNYLTKQEADDGAAYWGALYEGYTTDVHNDDPIDDTVADSADSTYSASKIEERISEIPSGGVEEAPIDGKQYGREDGAWTEVITGSFSGDLDDIDEGTTNKHFTSTEKTKLSGIEDGAEVNNISDANATDLTDGGATTLHKHSYNNLDDKPTIPVVSDVAYDATSWQDNTDAPSKNAVRDKIESMFSGLLKITVGTTEPVTPTTGDLWVDTN
jgi:hypothetical protein